MQTLIGPFRTVNALLGLVMLTFALSAPARQKTIITFDPEGSTGTSVVAINQAGVIAGDYTDATGQHGFLRRANGAIATFDPPGGANTSVLDLNSAGAIVGTYVDGNDNLQLFLRTAGGAFSTIELPGGLALILGVSINAKDEITGNYLDNTNFALGNFLRTTHGTVTTLHTRGGFVTPSGINDGGDIVGGACTFVDFIETCSGFLQTSRGTVTIFAPLDATSTNAVTINPGGAIAGTYTDPSGGIHGFLRTANGTVHTFDPPGSAATTVNVINPGETIAGTYIDASFEPHGFVRAHQQGDISTYDFPAAAPNTVSRFATVAGINPEGSVAGSYIDTIFSPPSTYDPVAHGFLRARDGTFTRVDPTGSIYTTVVGITPSGLVAGSYTDSRLVSHGFVLNGHDD